jgi:hypothetical protein
MKSAKKSIKFNGRMGVPHGFDEAKAWSFRSGIA